nr:hypothetical protein FVER53263_00111 [Fusarium verticillioides]
MAVSELRDLISHLSSADSLRPDFLGRLGYLYSDKLFYNYKLEDLKMALEVHQECLSLAGDNVVERANWLRHLGCSKLAAYRVFKDENDLQESINAYRIRFELAKAPEDVRLAITNLEKALELARKELEVSDVVQIIQSLANCYLAMYHDGGTLADVEQAIRYAQDAAGVEAQEASQVVNVTGLLGLCYTTKYKVTQCEDDLLKAIEADESDL